MIFPSIYQTQSLLACLMPSLFSKEHVISRSHPDNLVCGQDPLDPPKSDPSDPDCPGHPTHFQPRFLQFADDTIYANAHTYLRDMQLLGACVHNFLLFQAAMTGVVALS